MICAKFLFYYCFLIVINDIHSTYTNARIKRDNRICGNYNVKIMSRKEYSSKMHNKNSQLLISNEPIGIGSLGKVYIGYINGESNDKFNPQNCVAIKLVRNNFMGDIFLKGIELWKRVEQEIVPEKRSHIIAMIDHGNVKSNDHLVIMELGSETLNDCLENGGENCTGKDISELLLEMIVPLKELHQISMHLDYKPSNLVYVQNLGNTKAVLKIIDFDSALAIPNVRISQGRANAFENPYSLVITVVYTCPEYFRSNQWISSKADIWAYGISTYEVLLHQLKHNDWLKTENIGKIIEDIAELHRGFSTVKTFIKEFIDFNKDGWLDKPRYLKAIFAILHIWIEFPRYALLIMNTLDLDFVYRMTAIGISDYFRGKCRPPQVDGHFPGNFKIFHKITFEKLRQEIRMLKNNSEIVEKIANLMIKLEEKPRDWIEEIRGVEQICDTTTINWEIE